MTETVQVTISATARALTRKGFGTPMIAAYHTHYADRMRSYEDLAGMVSDGFIPDEPAYKLAAAIFSQEPSVEQLKIGRRANAWQQIIELTPAAPTVGKIYSLEIDGHDVESTATTTVLATECTALATACNAVNGHDVDAIIATGASTAGLQTISGASLDGVIGSDSMSPAMALEFVFSNSADWDATTAVVTGTDANGDALTEDFAIPNGGDATVTGSKLFATVTSVSIPAQTGTGGTFTLGTRARFTASGASGTKVVITTTLNGQLVTYAHDSHTSNLSLLDATADPGLEADLNAIKLADPDFYGFCLDSNGAAEVLAAAAWEEADGESMFVGQTCDTGATDTTKAADITSVLYTTRSYRRAPMFFHPTIGLNFIAAAMLGSRDPDDPGSDTWAYKTLAGIDSYVLTSTQEANLIAKNCSYYIDELGASVTKGGKVPMGEWADVVRFIDMLKARIRESVFAAIVNNKKIPYTDAGAEIIRGAVQRVLDLNTALDGSKGLSPDPAPYTTVPKVADVDPALKAARVIPDVNFAATLAGAIHFVQVNGRVTA